MIKKAILPAFLLLVSGMLNGAFCQEPDRIWQKLQPYFSPPAKYADSLGTFRSPLKFYDGSVVKTPADWSKRRNEILNKWQEMLGPWPALINKPAYELTDSIHRDNYTQYGIKYVWREGEKARGYLLVPDGNGMKPAVVTVFYEPESALGYKKPYYDIAVQLAKRGFVVLSTGSDPFPNDTLRSQYYPTAEKATVQPLSMLGYLAANAYNLLANMPFVDARRIGVTGHSYGGKWSMFASCLYEKFACAAWSDLGIVFDEARPNVNYYDPWYLGYYSPPWPKETTRNKGLYPRLKKEGYDLHELHALMAPRPFLVSGGSEDQPERWVALNHTVAVNRLLGYENRVGMTNRDTHSPNPESNELLCLFFERFLKYNGIAEKK